MNDVGVDILVAKYALISVEHRSVEAAVDFIYGSEDNDMLTHRFFGYQPDSYTAINECDQETGQAFERCFVCEKFECEHKADSARDRLET